MLVVCFVFEIIFIIVYQSESCVSLKDREWKNPGQLLGGTLLTCMKAEQAEVHAVLFCCLL